MIETLVLKQGFKLLFFKEEFPSLKNKTPTFPLRVHYLLKVAFLKMLTKILNEQIRFKKSFTGHFPTIWTLQKTSKTKRPDFNNNCAGIQRQVSSFGLIHSQLRNQELTKQVCFIQSIDKQDNA